MPRGQKCRRVCVEPMKRYFKVDTCQNERVTLCVEELESIRLMDFEGLDQQEAAKRMEVSRGTFQRILYEARRKVAEALVQGKSIVVEGGNYAISETACNTLKRCKCCKFLKQMDKNKGDEVNE